MRASDARGRQHVFVVPAPAGTPSRCPIYRETRISNKIKYFGPSRGSWFLVLCLPCSCIVPCSCGSGRFSRVSAAGKEGSSMIFRYTQGAYREHPPEPVASQNVFFPEVAGLQLYRPERKHGAAFPHPVGVCRRIAPDVFLAGRTKRQPCSCVLPVLSLLWLPRAPTALMLQCATYAQHWSTTENSRNTLDPAHSSTSTLGFFLSFNWSQEFHRIADLYYVRYHPGCVFDLVKHPDERPVS